jgi:glycosyltransferase involved in cell wall biosynthesis
MKEKISVVIPTLNEEKNLPYVLDTIPQYISETIVVDGHSKDKTVGIAKKYNAKILYDEEGKGSALIKGLKAAKGDIVIMMDADCSHRIEEFGLLIEGIKGGYDTCMGSRFIQGGGTADMSLLRKFGNKFFVFLVNLFWKMNYSDLCYGYRSFNRNAIKKLNLGSKEFAIETEISIKAAKNKLKVLEIPSFEKKRKSGEGKLKTFKHGREISKRIITELFRK